MTTKIPLLSTAYLPSIHYMACLATHERVVIEQHETFPKQTFRNRTVIATGNGELMLNVPVSKPEGNHTKTCNVEVSYHEPWNVRHWRAIESAYNAAPYFLYYRDGLENILLREYRMLLALNHDILSFLLEKLKINCTIEYSSEYRPMDDRETDLRLSLTAKNGQNMTPCPPYSQVFDSRYGFMPNMSAIDLLFNLGPEARQYLLCL